MKKLAGKISFLLVIVAILITGILLLNNPEEDLSYDTYKVSKGNIEKVISGNGKLTASENQNEFAKVMAEIEEIYYLEGDKVEVGYPIIKLNSSNYDSNVKNKEIEIKQAELLKQNIGEKIKKLEIKSEVSGYISGLTIKKGNYVTENTIISNVIENSKYEAVFQFAYYEDKPILVGSTANIMLMDSLSYVAGTVTKVSDMRKLTVGNAQVIDVTIEVVTTGYSLDGAKAKAEINDDSLMRVSADIAEFTSINLNTIYSESFGKVKEIYAYEGKFIKSGEVIAVLENLELENELYSVNLNLDNLNTQLETLKKQEKNYLISAEIAGTIISQEVKVGDMVEEGELLTSIANKDMMEFVIFVDELDIDKIDYDHEVRVTIDALNDTKINPLVGKIVSISHDGIENTGETKYGVTIRIQGRYDMKISMNAKADIVIKNVMNVLYVPINAVIYENEKEYVEVLKEDGVTIERREVTTGISDEANIEIKEGLEEGENVILMHAHAHCARGRPLNAHIIF